MDGDRRTVQLPRAKADGITKDLRRILPKRTVAIKIFQKIVSKLRHAAIILPAAKSLFTPLNNAMKGDPVAVSLGKNSEVRATLLDFVSLINDLALPVINYIAGLDNIWADEASRIAARIKLRPGSNLPSVSRSCCPHY
jgi:hypothetical protein